MSRLLRYLLCCLAVLPLRVLYVLADLIYIVVYYIIGYRRDVVRENLEECFPSYDKAERLKIERQFYRNFADYIVETVKLLHISDGEMSRRMKFDNPEILDELVNKGRNVAVYFSHCGNWEWAPSVTLHCHPNVETAYCQVYRPLKNVAMDVLMLSIRSRFGSISIPKSLVLRRLIELRRKGLASVTGFMSDQKPSHGDPTLPLYFLGRPTAFITGTEQLARRLNMAAVYWDMYKDRRGYYHINTRLIAEDVASTAEGYTTRTYASMLEETITRNPSIWLWTHKRWKIPVIMP